MISKRSLLEHVLVAYREGDMDECIRLVRTLVDAAPQAIAPRQLLASIFAQTGRGRLALGHYRKLLIAAIARGAVLRAIAFQKQIDAFQPRESHAPARWSELQKQLRSHGQAPLVVLPAGSRPWMETQLLALPRPWFERLAGETRFELLGMAPQSTDHETGTVWEMLAGRMRWSFALPDGCASAERLAVEGDAVWVEPELGPRARLTFFPELPVETLCFPAPLVRELREVLIAARPSPAAARAAGATPFGRPGRTRPTADSGPAPSPPASATAAPPPLAEAPAGAAEWDPPADSGDWLEFGIVALDGPPAKQGGLPTRDEESHALAPVAGDSAAEPASPEGASASPAASAPEAARPPAASAGSREGASDPPSERPAGDPAETPPAGEGRAGERRRHPRVAVSFESRLALLRLTDSRTAPIRGRLTDLSTSGLRVRFAKQDLAIMRGALADAVIAIDLELPGTGGPLRVAAQVRWLHVEERGDEARLGIEFLLLTEPDRRRIAGTLARAALSAGLIARPAA